MTANFTDGKSFFCSHSLNNFTFNKYIGCKDRYYFLNFQIFRQLFRIAYRKTRCRKSNEARCQKGITKEPSLCYSGV